MVIRKKKKETTKLTKYKDVVKNYTYDSAGNKESFVVKVGDNKELSLNYIYDGESKLTSVTDENGEEVVGYAYDTDGNLSERTVAGNGMTTSYAYDYQNRLTTLKNSTGSGVISEYTSEYLTNGQKSKEVSKVQNKDGKTEEKTVFVWDGDQLVMELSEGGKVQKRYLRGNDLVLADEGKDSETTFYVMDSHGNHRLKKKLSRK
ncbi:MAG: RHS repeat protein [Eubacterium sp.]|nr:RHS repeat protein [Eubacterium sp.]